MPSRRQFLRSALTFLLGAMAAFLFTKAGRSRHRWQIDPRKCVACGRCATHCVVQPSAVKCIHAYAMCGYCKLCFGYFAPDAPRLDESMENQVCPTNAIRRTFIEDPYFDYTIEEEKCIGCAICVKGCSNFGNGSLFLQVIQSRCVNCTDCAIARTCPSNAFTRVPEKTPYLLKDRI